MTNSPPLPSAPLVHPEVHVPPPERPPIAVVEPPRLPPAPAEHAPVAPVEPPRRPPAPAEHPAAAPTVVSAAAAPLAAKELAEDLAGVGGLHAAYQEARAAQEALHSAQVDFAAKAAAVNRQIAGVLDRLHKLYPPFPTK